jgi:hypothetical protein
MRAEDGDFTVAVFREACDDPVRRINQTRVPESGSSTRDFPYRRKNHLDTTNAN